MKAKKSLGQNWLVDKTALKKIIEAAELSKKDSVLEVGPGRGALTEELMKRVGKVIVIEKDEELARELVRKYESRIMNHELDSKFKTLPIGRQVQNSKFFIITGDILQINLPKLLEDAGCIDYKLVANIPYYITGKLLRLIFETKYSPRLVVLLVQKEVAERVCAKVGQMSKLSVSVQFFGKPEIVANVPAESFDPVPKVDSAILKITPYNSSRSPLILKGEANDFFRLIKVGFSARRKTLANNLSCGLKIPKEEIEKVLTETGKDSKVRAQDLSVEDWEKLRELIF